MSDKIKMTEELARGLFKIAETSIEIDGNSEDNFITSLKCSGFIYPSCEYCEVYEDKKCCHEFGACSTQIGAYKNFIPKNKFDCFFLSDEALRKIIWVTMFFNLPKYGDFEEKIFLIKKELTQLGLLTK